MFGNTVRPPRPRLTARIFLYGLVDIFGLTCIALGGIWLATGKNAVFSHFPASTVEAVTAIIGGAAVMLWAVSHILREIAKQGPEMQASYEAYMARRHGKTPDSDDGDRP